MSDGLPVVKYQALGNDYLVVDGRGGGTLAPDAIRRICDRHRGAGSDGILLRGPDPEPGLFGLRILNPDGSEAEKSGNGLRIFARWLWDRGEVESAPFRVRTPGGDVACRVAPGGATVRVEMGRVRFGMLRETLVLEDGRRVEVSSADVGNPHCVVLVEAPDGPDEAAARALGPLLEVHPAFPNRTNVQLAKPLARDRLQVEIWERGAGYTLASGSSACAAAAVAHELGLCDASLTVAMPGGELAVEIGPERDVVQEGPVERVYEARLFGEALEPPG